ncbi:MAG: 5'-methylthioadenosine/adenosylhomocysteine nucleosidase [Synergistaceae bacterium]|nr:5'-methylthioadenosine/adenosylhomocysteine nucleosidase [Synergistaceae bacterium]
MKKFFVLFLLAIIFVPISACAESSIKLGIIGAMDVEVETLKNAAEISRKITRAEMEFCEGKLGNVDVVIVRCGMGKVNAGICVQILADIFNVTHVINTGVAGSLNNALNIGDIVVAVDAVQHDYDVTPINFEKGEIPYTGLVAFNTDEKLREQAVNAAKKVAPGIQVIKGRICTGDQFIATKEQKNKIISSFGGDCCEMESGAIAQACYLNKIPFVIIRAVADKADKTETVDFHKFETQTAKLCASITEYMIKNF